MFKIPKDKGPALLALLDRRDERPAGPIAPFKDRSVPQGLGDGDPAPIPIQLFGDLYPCGFALARTVRLATDPPMPNAEEAFWIKDFQGLWGKAGWYGWVSGIPIAQASGEAGDSSASSPIVVYPLISIGPGCEEDSSSEPSSVESESDWSSGGPSDSDISHDDSDLSSVTGGSSELGSSELPSSEPSSLSEPSDSSSEESSSSEKGTAIVPASWSPTGFAALFVHEDPTPIFGDRRKVRAAGGDTFFMVDPKYVEVCEPGSLMAIAGTDEATPVGAKIIGSMLRIRLPAGTPTIEVTVFLSGIRKGKAHLRFDARRRDQFEANERFINSAYPK